MSALMALTRAIADVMHLIHVKWLYIFIWFISKVSVWKIYVILQVVHYSTFLSSSIKCWSVRYQSPSSTVKMKWSYQTTTAMNTIHVYQWRAMQINESLSPLHPISPHLWAGSRWFVLNTMTTSLRPGSTKAFIKLKLGPNLMGLHLCEY